MKKFLGHIVENLSIIAMVIMLALAFVNVISRYFLHASISFTEEITSALLVLLSMLGTALAAKKHAHLGLTILTDLMKPKTKAVFVALGNVMGCIFSIVLFVTGIGMVRNQYHLKQVSVALQWPEWIYGTFLLIGSFFMTICFAQAISDILKTIKEEEKNK